MFPISLKNSGAMTMKSPISRRPMFFEVAAPVEHRGMSSWQLRQGHLVVQTGYVAHFHPGLGGLGQARFNGHDRLGRRCGLLGAVPKEFQHGGYVGQVLLAEFFASASSRV